MSTTKTPRRALILAYVAAHPGSTGVEIAKGIGHEHRWRAGSEAVTMVQRGLLRSVWEKTGKGRWGGRLRFYPVQS